MTHNRTHLNLETLMLVPGAAVAMLGVFYVLASGIRERVLKQ